MQPPSRNLHAQLMDEMALARVRLLLSRLRETDTNSFISFGGLLDRQRDRTIHSSSLFLRLVVTFEGSSSLIDL